MNRLSCGRGRQRTSIRRTAFCTDDFRRLDEATTSPSRLEVAGRSQSGKQCQDVWTQLYFSSTSSRTSKREPPLNKCLAELDIDIGRRRLVVSEWGWCRRGSDIQL